MMFFFKLMTLECTTVLEGNDIRFIY